jgi:hypothetical protein
VQGIFNTNKNKNLDEESYESEDIDDELKRLHATEKCVIY